MGRGGFCPHARSFFYTFDNSSVIRLALNPEDKRWIYMNILKQGVNKGEDYGFFGNDYQHAQEQKHNDNRRHP